MNLEKPKNEETNPRRRRRLFQPVTIGFFLAVVTLIAFWPVVHAGFIDYDDHEYVVSNPHVQAGLSWRGIAWAMHSYYASNWHPLTWISHMLDVDLFGTSPMGPHCVNLAFHIANAVLLFGLLWRMTCAKWRSAFVAALFALHPIHVESVAWISERKDVLSTFFGLLTLLAYAEFVEQRKDKKRGAKLYYGVALLLFALGLLSKPMLVTLPFVMLLLDYWPLKRFQFNNRKETYAILWQLFLEKVPFFLLTVLACAATVMAQRGSMQPLYNLPLGDRMENSLVSYLRYLGKIFWPAGLAIPYLHVQAWPLTTVLLALVVVAGVCLWMIWVAPKNPFVATGWFWFLGTLIPVIGLLQVGIQSMADRYTYLPAIGIFMIVAWGANRMGERVKAPKAVLGGSAILILSACTALTHQQASYWQSTERLFSHSAAVTEDNYVALTCIGLARFHDGQFEEATNYYSRALEINPGYSDAMNNMGVALQGKDDEASIVWYRRALLMKPSDSGILYNLGNEFTVCKQYVEACDCFEAVLRIRPDHFEALNNLANVQVQMGRVDEAVVNYQKALQLEPRDAKVIKNLGVALLKEGKAEEAAVLLRRAVRGSPKDAEAHYSLGLALATQGHWDEAVLEYVESLRLDPANAEAEYNLGYAFRVQKRLDEAAQHLQKAVQLKADFPIAHYNLGCVLADAGHTEEAVTQIKEALREKPDYHEAEEELRLLNGLKAK
ncbi:MAG TPA: tetratricopeptide repeat protein [Verrucomicrobiae bacterium]|nr:tetratricopeptide repeat protein [Verrucomicrobiae bacterium]